MERLQDVKSELDLSGPVHIWMDGTGLVLEEGGSEHAFRHPTYDLTSEKQWWCCLIPGDGRGGVAV